MSERYYSRIIRLGLPILVGQLGMIVTGFADTKMVGIYSTAALASASFVNNLFNVVIFMCVGFTYGLTPLVGALYAQGRHRRIGLLMRNALWLNVMFAAVVSAAMLALYYALPHMGQPAELLPLIRPYYLLYVAGVIPIAIFNAFAQWSYAINRTKMPMWIILAANVINIAGNWMLIYGHLGCPEMGLTGAGIATLIARVFCPVSILLIFFVGRAYRRYRQGFAAGSIQRSEMGRITRTSWPVSLQMTFESGSFTLAAVFTGWLGTTALASFQILLIIGTLGFCVYYSMAAAVSVLVSNAAGLGDCRRMRRIAFAGFRIILCLVVAASLFFVFGARGLIHQFSDDPAVTELTLTLIFPLVLYQIADATQINFANALRGTSRVMPMLWIAFVSYIVVGIPATYLLGFTAALGLYGIILSFSVSLFLAAGLFLWRFLYETRCPPTAATDNIKKM